MHYLKLNDELKNLISLVPDVKNKKIFLGCKPFCKSQIIALDELELMRKLLKESKIKDISPEEFLELKSSTKSAYYVNYHSCKYEETKSSNNNENNNEKETSNNYNEKEILAELKKDKVPEKEKPGLFKPNLDYEYMTKVQEELNNEAANKHKFSVRESNLGYGFNIIGSFFLVCFGCYYFCDMLLNLKKENTYKIMIVVSVVVLIAEAFLLMIKLDKETKNEIRGKGLDKTSFAYKFNKEYREKVDNEISKRKERFSNNKVYNKEKTD